MTPPRLCVRFAAPLLLAAGLAAPALAEPGAFGEPKMLIHGNYCGPGNNAPLPPIDALDAACARHDACTPYGGLPTQACNLQLQREARMIARDPREPQEERAMASLIATTAILIPARPQRPVSAPASVAGPGAAYAPDSRWPGAVDPDADEPDDD